jgi:hypothetical protein
MDNLVESLNKQATNARALRSKHETEAIGLMQQMGITGSTIQISGSSLQIKHQRTPGGLTWSFLEKETAAWAAANGIPVGKAAGLLKWLHDHREIRECDVLQKLGSGGGNSKTELKPTPTK